MTISRMAWPVACLVLAALAPHTFAYELLYDFEGDSGTTVTNKLATGGGQNGTIYNSVDPTYPGTPNFGSQSGFFDVPAFTPTNRPPFSTLEVPDTTFGADYSLTVAGWFDHDRDVNTRVHAFSSYKGTGPVNDSILFDFRYNETSTNIRGIVNNESQSFNVPGVAAPGYHHYAMTVGGGEMKLFFDGAELGTKTLTPGYVNSNSNIFIGEDPHNGGGSSNEQLIGNVDDVLVLGRALQASDISQLYAGGIGAPVSSIVTPAPGERAVYYSFDSDSGTNATDLFPSDGAQNGVSHALAGVDTNSANAMLGGGSYNFQDPRANDPTDPATIYSQINAGPVGSLGTQFTISAAVNPFGPGFANNNFARVFSSYLGTGTSAGQLILDFNPYATISDSVRLFLPSSTGEGQDKLTVKGDALPDNQTKIDLNPSTLQTLTAVYNNGDVKLYLDGTEIGSATFAPIAQDLGANDLRIGEDRGGYPFASANENFVGSMDDVLVLQRALDPTQVALLAADGANALLASLPLPGDFNNDTEVDDADLTVWQTAYGTTAGADANGDSASNGADFLIWQQNFGAGGAASVSSQAVPEPSSVVMFVAIAGFGLLARKRGGRVS